MPSWSIADVEPLESNIYSCLQSNTHVVLVSLDRAETELQSANKKVFKIDDHMGIAYSGLIPDGRVLCKYMRNQCLSHK